MSNSLTTGEAAHALLLQQLEWALRQNRRVGNFKIELSQSDETAEALFVTNRHHCSHDFEEGDLLENPTLRQGAMTSVHGETVALAATVFGWAGFPR